MAGKSRDPNGDGVAEELGGHGLAGNVILPANRRPPAAGRVQPAARGDIRLQDSLRGRAARLTAHLRAAVEGMRNHGPSEAAIAAGGEPAWL